MKVLIFVFGVCISLSSLAQQGDASVSMPSTNGALTQALIGLAVVVGFIFSLAWLLKRLNLVGLSQNNHIQVVTAVTLGAREKAVLINVKGQQLLLGVAPGRVSTLHVFECTDATPEASSTVKQAFPVSEKNSSQSMESSLSAKSASEFSKKLNAFLGVGNKS